MPDFRVIEVKEAPYLYVARECGMAPEEISAQMGKAFGDVWAFMQANAIAPTGGALSVYYSYDPERMAFRAGFQIGAADAGRAGGEVKADVTPGGRVLHFTHVGPYATLRDDYARMMAHIEAEGLTIEAPTWEIYMNDPGQVPEAELVTEVYTKLR